MNSTTTPTSTIYTSRPLEITGTINTTRTNVRMGTTNPMHTTGCPKGMKTGIMSHIQMTDTTRIPTDTRMLDRKNSHRHRTSDHPRTNTSRTNQSTSVQSEIKSHKEIINICGLNVCGLNSKLNFGELNDYIKKFDIFCITESKVSKGPHIDNYTVFNIEKNTKKYPYPGIHGLQVYVADHIAGLCYQINDTSLICESALWIKIAENLIVGALYIPHEGSKHYCHEFFTDLALDICDLKSKYDLPIMLIGDFNSRTGTINDILLIENTDNVLDPSNFIYPDIINTLKSLNIPIHRSNKDAKANNNGKKLIEMCKCHELCIVNGRLGSDKNIGNPTCNDVSTIDYVICTPDLLPNLTDFTVHNFCPLLSDKHRPISVNLNMTKPPPDNNTDTTNTDETNTNTHYTRCKWDSNKKGEYTQNFDMSKINNISNNLSTLNVGEVTLPMIDSLTQGLNELFIDPAKTTGMFKQVPLNTKKRKPNTNRPFVNAACITSKNNYNLMFLSYIFENEIYEKAVEE